MSTAREHMAADLAYVLNDTGEAATEIAIDGTPVRAILTARSLSTWTATLLI